MITYENFNGFSPNLVCALIVWSFALGLLIGKFCQFLKELFCHEHVHILVLDDNFSKYQWIFTKLGMCIDIVDISVGIANGRISSSIDSFLAATRLYFTFRTIT